MPDPPVPRLHESLRTRGAAHNPHNRFERITVEEDGEFLDHERVDYERAARGAGEPDAGLGVAPIPPTHYYADPSRTIIARNESPDVPFDTSINPYRGCEHGCIYCYARPGHEFLGLSAGLDFETKIFVKERAPELLRAALSKKSWQPQTIAIGGVTDGYQPAERKLRITRRCLEVLAEFGNPVAIVTKSGLVVRDTDVLAELAKHRAAAVLVSVTTLDPALHRVLEPRTAAPSQRLATIEALANAGVPVGAMVAPIIPGLNDHEISKIVDAVASAGARHAGHISLRLPHTLVPLFEDWLERHFPERKSKVLNQLRSMRGGRLNDPRFHTRMRGEGLFADHVSSVFRVATRRAGIDAPRPALSTGAFRRPSGPQLSLFDDA